jgi:hypothetical protein
VATKYAQLSIDITTELLDSRGVVDVTVRVKRFIAKAFGTRRRRRFAATWMPEGLLDVEGGAERSESLRVFLSPENVSVGDRILLVAKVDGASAPAVEQAHREAESDRPDEGWATLYDGAALFVLHVLDRADPLTRDRLSSLHSPRDTAEVVDPEERHRWAKLRDDILAVLVEQEIRGPASIQALSGHLAREGFDLELLNEAEEPVPAVAVLSEVLDARKAPSRRVRGRTGQELYLLQSALLREYEPFADAHSLLRLLEQSRETFGSTTTAPDSHAVSQVLEEVARGARPPIPGLPR